VRRRLPLAAALVAAAALLAGGYVAAGQAGLADMTAVGAAALALAIRGRLGAGTEHPPELKRHRRSTTADLPSYTRITSALEWAVLSKRQYEHTIRPMLQRMGAPGHTLPVPPPGDGDGPGPSLACFDRVITMLEER
jgi:hypothetical protein